MPTPESEARVEIDSKLAAAGWVVQDHGFIYLGLGMGMIFRKFSPNPGPRSTYLSTLYGDVSHRIIEAKVIGANRTLAEAQTHRTK
jgi:type I restriction enzyme, R subunit